jgi:hypothetical protein
VGAILGPGCASAGKRIVFFWRRSRTPSGMVGADGRSDGHPAGWVSGRSRSTWRSCPSLASEVEGTAAGAFKTVSVDGLSIR